MTGARRWAPALCTIGLAYLLAMAIGLAVIEIADGRLDLGF